DGRMVYLWRAVDAEGEVLDVLVQSKRNKHAALKLMRKLLKKYAFAPERLVTDDLRSYSAAVRDLGIERRHERGRWKNTEPRIRISRRVRPIFQLSGLGQLRVDSKLIGKKRSSCAIPLVAWRHPAVQRDPSCRQSARSHSWRPPQAQRPNRLDRMAACRRFGL